MGLAQQLLRAETPCAHSNFFLKAEKKNWNFHNFFWATRGLLTLCHCWLGGRRGGSRRWSPMCRAPSFGGLVLWMQASSPLWELFGSICPIAGVALLFDGGGRSASLMEHEQITVGCVRVVGILMSSLVCRRYGWA
jgi:hypothetical protein